MVDKDKRLKAMLERLYELEDDAVLPPYLQGIKDLITVAIDEDEELLVDIEALLGIFRKAL